MSNFTFRFNDSNGTKRTITVMEEIIYLDNINTNFLLRNCMIYNNGMIINKGCKVEEILKSNKSEEQKNEILDFLIKNKVIQ